VPYYGFHTGYKQMIIRPDELLARVRLPRGARDLRHYYRKVGTRRAQAISKVCFAAVAQMDGSRIGDLRLALGSVAPIPIRCMATESALRYRKLDGVLIEEGKRELAGEIAPIDDIRSTRDYRLLVSLNLLEDFLLRLESPDV
jgi:CO/xanthine dehydrogenase FAD-binding subunit